MNEPPEIRESLSRFRERFPSTHRTAFLMMRYRDSDILHRLHNATALAFQKRGIQVLRANDHWFHQSLLINLRTYLHGCGFGIAIFEQLDNEDHNPNVALEVGYLMALEKPICLFKELSLISTPSDILAQMYEVFDASNPEQSIDKASELWLRKSQLLVPPCSFVVNLHLSDGHINRAHLEAIGEGFRLYTNNPSWLATELKSIQPSEDLRSATFRFTGDLKHFEYLTQLLRRNAINIPGVVVDRIEIESDDSLSETVDYLWHDGSVRKRTLYQICRLAAFQGMEAKAEKANQLVGSATNDPNQVRVYISEADGFWYFHSNYQDSRWPHPAKVMCDHPTTLFHAFLALIGTSGRKLPQHERNSLFAAHVRHVNYLIEKSAPSFGNIALDWAGASNVALL